MSNQEARLIFLLDAVNNALLVRLRRRLDSSGLQEGLEASGEHGYLS
jgi:hypothetical protein